MSSHADLEHLMGAFVLGGLSAADRQRFEDHLQTCDACRAEVLRHSSIPGLLGAQRTLRSTPAPEPAVLDRLLEAVRQERATRRRRSIVTAVAAAVVAAALATTAALVVNQDDGTSKPEVTAVVTFRPATGSSAAATGVLVEKGWGTEIRLSAWSLPGDGPFRLVVTGPRGTREVAAAWGPTSGGGASVVGATSFAPRDIAAVHVVDPRGEVLGVEL